jgi:VIT1/CCC1 family predicted Fe2+/Mn2+ transporter
LTGQMKERSDASVGELVSHLSEQVSRLVRDEVALAKAELRDSARHAGIGAGLFGAAGILGLFAFAVVVATAVIALDLALALWLSALIVALALAAAAAVAALMGKKQAEQVAPLADRTVETAKQDVEEIKGAARRDH